MLCVKFPQVQYIDFSEIVHVLKAVAVLTSEHLKLSTVFVVIHLLSAKVTPEWRLNPDFGSQKKCPFSLTRGVSSIEVTNTKMMLTFFQDQLFCPLNGGVPWVEVCQRRGSTVCNNSNTEAIK